jgi:hypothetical protein
MSPTLPIFMPAIAASAAAVTASDCARAAFNGQLVWMLERRQIENQGPEQIAAMLTAAFDRFCTPASAAQ